MSELSEEVKAGWAGSAGTWDDTEATGAATGPWPPKGSYPVKLVSIDVRTAPFRTGADSQLPGTAVQFCYEHLSDGKAFKAGDEWKGAINTVPDNLDEVMPTLAPKKGTSGNQPQVRATLGRICGSLAVIEGEKPADPMMAIEDINKRIGNGQEIGLMVGITSRDQQSKVNPGQTNTYHTDYINSAFDAAVVTEDA